MPAPIIPWQPSNIPSEIQSELNRRKKNRSFNFVNNSTANWDANGDWNTYKGPQTSWIRVCSNSEGNPSIKKPRFVFYGGKGFYQTYGFSKSAAGTNQQIIGYTPGGSLTDYTGQQHTIENSLTSANDKNGNFPIHVPTPEISKIDVVVQKELFRRVTIEWVCFSFKQLEYMTPYFLVPGITVMVEWGWNNFNPTSLVHLENTSQMRDLWANSYPLYTDNILQSKGNYDVVYGIISNFNWSIEGNKIICSTEITSKDRLYAGIAKDTTLNVKDSDTSQPNEVFQNIKKFLEKDDTVKSIKRIAASPTPEKEIVSLDSPIWSDIFLSILHNTKNPKFKDIKLSYLHGVFSGRTKDDTQFGKPQPNDFDNKTPEGDTTGEQLWLSMGLIVEILNYFSNLPGGKGKPMFKVDIMNSVIGANPNIISCDSRVLIPNSRAPKFHYGLIGLKSYINSPYETQYVHPSKISQPSGSLVDTTLMKTFYQRVKGSECYRSDLNVLINRNRIKNVRMPIWSWCFPAKSEEFSNTPMPADPDGLPGNYIEKDYSGLLSNIYFNYGAFKTIVSNNTAATYTEIYNEILKVLMDSVDGFWDLALVEAEQTHTIVDKKYIGKTPIKLQGDPVYTFDLYDSDSLIKSLKFSPKLSDAQASRAIYGSVNNKNSKYATVDKNDLLDFQANDAVIFNDKEKANDDDKSSISEKRVRDRENLKSMILKVQNINQPNDPAFQMSIPSPVANQVEIVKLILPDQELLRLLLDDKDEENNSRYCAVQPGIILEMTISGIGGLRTFQYFLVKNLPKPYSDSNIIFRITDVHQTLETGNWETTIRAQPMPLRKYIKTRIVGPNGSWPADPQATL